MKQHNQFSRATKRHQWLKAVKAALFGLALLCAHAVQAQDYSAPFYYTVNPDNSVTITGYKGPGGALTIPYEIAGLLVSSIGEGAFVGNTNLTSVLISNNVAASIGVDAFAACSNLANVTIGNSVTSIGGGAFELCGRLTNITIGNSVTSIGENGFSKCTNLAAITIPNSVTSIGNSAFWESGLASVTIPDSVTNIANYAFWYSSNLASVTIGSGVTSIGIQVFSDCPSLGAFNVDAQNPAFMSAAGVLFTKNQSILVQYPVGNAATSYTIPNAVTGILEWAFLGCTNLGSVTIDIGVTNIGYEAFAFCADLTNISIPDNVTTIGGEAFSDCAGLTSAVIGHQAGTITYADFAQCSNLAAVTIESGVTNIGELAFYEDGLTSLTIPNSVTSIGEDAFYGNALTNLIIPNGVVSIGETAFADCGNLRTVYFLGDAPAVGLEAFGGDNATVYYLAGTTGWSNFSTNTGLLAVALNGITFTANPTNGAAPLAVSFTSPGVDSAGNAISNWNWNFGDGSTSTAQNPFHVYAAAGTYYPALFATNSMGVAVLGSSSVCVNVSPPPGIGGVNICGANLVLNGSNGLAGATYHLLTSANLALPLSQWTPVATNNLSASGNFTITLTNAVNANILQQFYILQWP